MFLGTVAKAKGTVPAGEGLQIWDGTKVTLREAQKNHWTGLDWLDSKKIPVAGGPHVSPSLFSFSTATRTRMSKRPLTRTKTSLMWGNVLAGAGSAVTGGLRGDPGGQLREGRFKRASRG